MACHSDTATPNATCSKTKKYAAEFIGTAILTLFGAGTAVIAGSQVTSGSIDPVALGLYVALAFGLTLTFLIYAIGPVSGCHVNPAVTVAMMILGKKCYKSGGFYIVAQVLGAIVGTAILHLITSNSTFYNASGQYGANGFGLNSTGYNQTAAFVAEFVLTFIFLFVILNVTSSRGNGTTAGIAIGFTLAVIHLFGIPITGTSVNPARSIGPALFTGGVALQQLWLFIVAPVLGAAAAAYLVKTCCPDDAAACTAGK
jgi:aquaporin Z